MTTPFEVADFATPTPCWIGPGATLADADRLMRQHHIHHLPVLEQDRLLGVVSQRDLQLLEAIRGVEPESVPVEEAMSHAPYIVRRHTPLEVAVLHMWKNKIGSALVVEHDQLVGVFTTTDALLALVEALTGKPARTVAHHRSRQPAR